MLRRIPLLVLVSVPLAAVAAPVPLEDDAAKLRRIYGTWHDPDKDCKYELTEGKLRITIPDKHHSLSQNPGLGNAPRV